jgi:hypothetical protein
MTSDPPLIPISAESLSNVAGVLDVVVCDFMSWRYRLCGRALRTVRGLRYKMTESPRYFYLQPSPRFIT